MATCRMSDLIKNELHLPVLLEEAIAGLNIIPNGIYIDATFGRGSHSSYILNSLSPQGQLIAFDKDLEAVAYAKKHFASDPRFQIYHQSFANMQQTLEDLNQYGHIDGILFDLGVSSPQLDSHERGFSFSRDGQLDMRMDTTQGINAKQWLATVDEATLAKVLWEYGEEKFSRRIAKAIVEQRIQKPINTTLELVAIIEKAVPFRKWHDKHPATRSFQAIRIAINQELTELNQGLHQALTALKIGGRLAVISFHSLEDRLVKQFIKHQEKGDAIPRDLPIRGHAFLPKLLAIGKAIKPTEAEININPRARSAILRLAEKKS